MVCHKCCCVLSIEEEQTNPHSYMMEANPGQVSKYTGILCDSCHNEEIRHGAKEDRHA